MDKAFIGDKPNHILAYVLRGDDLRFTKLSKLLDGHRRPLDRINGLIVGKLVQVLNLVIQIA